MRLNPKEKTWLKKIQALLDAPPSDRLGFYTIGDPIVVVYDRSKDEEINALMDKGRGDFCNCVDAEDAQFEIWLKFPTPVHSTAG